QGKRIRLARLPRGHRRARLQSRREESAHRGPRPPRPRRTSCRISESPGRRRRSARETPPGTRNRAHHQLRIQDSVVMTLRQLAAEPHTLPIRTTWYLVDLAEARGKQELFTRQSPQKLKVL